MPPSSKVHHPCVRTAAQQCEMYTIPSDVWYRKAVCGRVLVALRVYHRSATGMPRRRYLCSVSHKQKSLFGWRTFHDPKFNRQHQDIRRLKFKTPGFELLITHINGTATSMHYTNNNERNTRSVFGYGRKHSHVIQTVTVRYDATILHTVQLLVHTTIKEHITRFV